MLSEISHSWIWILQYYLYGSLALPNSLNELSSKFCHTVEAHVQELKVAVTTCTSNESLVVQVNKPYLPIAAKNLSVEAAWFLVISLATIGTTITSRNFGLLVTSLYIFGLFLGTVYSIPPFRLKQFAAPAALIIATVRGFLLNFGVYYSVRSAFNLPFQWSPAILYVNSNAASIETRMYLKCDFCLKPHWFSCCALSKVHHVFCHHFRTSHCNHKGFSGCQGWQALLHQNVCHTSGCAESCCVG